MSSFSKRDAIKGITAGRTSQPSTPVSRIPLATMNAMSAACSRRRRTETRKNAMPTFCGMASFTRFAPNAIVITVTSCGKPAYASAASTSLVVASASAAEFWGL